MLLLNILLFLDVICSDRDDLGIRSELELFKVDLDVPRLDACLNVEFVSLEGLLVLDHPGDGVLAHVLPLADDGEDLYFGKELHLRVLLVPLDGLLSGHLLGLLQGELLLAFFYFFIELKLLLEVLGAAKVRTLCLAPMIKGDIYL